MRSHLLDTPAHSRAQAGSTGKPGAREHIAYIGYFRAVAMLMIVTGHTYALAWTHGLDQDPTRAASLMNVLPAI